MTLHCTRSDAIRSIAIRGIAIRGHVPLDPVMHKYPRISYLHRDYVCVGDLASSQVVNPAHSAHTGSNAMYVIPSAVNDIDDDHRFLSVIFLNWQRIKKLKRGNDTKKMLVMTDCEVVGCVVQHRMVPG